jgi:hypothetical protein
VPLLPQCETYRGVWGNTFAWSRLSALFQMSITSSGRSSFIMRSLAEVGETVWKCKRKTERKKENKQRQTLLYMHTLVIYIAIITFYYFIFCFYFAILIILQLVSGLQILHVNQ